MTVAEFLGSLRALDVQIAVDGDRLRVNAPTGVLSDAHRTELQQRKAEIIDFLRAARQLASQQRAIVPLESRGSRVPIFAVAGHNGDVFCYRALAAHLGPAQPFFGLQPPGVDEGTAPLTTIDELAAYFAAQIRAVHKDGPLTIAGYCAGGTVALELACQLAETGVDVRNLILFGAPYPTTYRPFPQFVAICLHYLSRLRVHAHALWTLPAAERKRYLSGRLERRAAPSPETDPVMIRRRRVEVTTVAAIQKYRPRSFAGHIDLVLPCQSWTRSPDAPLRWVRLAASNATFFGPEACAGDTMLLADYAPTFAEMVNTVQSGPSEGAQR